MSLEQMHMWPWELVGTEQEARVSALSMAQRNATGDTASRLAVSLVVQWAHRSPPHTRRLGRNKRCNVCTLLGGCF